MYDVQWPSDQFLIFVNDDQGHDQVHHDARDCGRGEVGQAHVGVNGKGQRTMYVGRRRRKIVLVRVAGQRRGISGTL